VDLEFSELECLVGKNWSEAILFFESRADWSLPKHAHKNCCTHTGLRKRGHF
jgi:hypothetical protein